jgi:hypothetical protein
MELIEYGLIGIFITVIIIVLYLTMKKKGKPPTRDISPTGISLIVEEEIAKRKTNGGN